MITLSLLFQARHRTPRRLDPSPRSRIGAPGHAAPFRGAWCVAACLMAALPAVSTAQVRATAPRVQDPAAVIAQVESLIRDQAASYPGSVTVTVDAPRLNNQPPCDKLEAFLAGSSGLQPRTPVGVRCLAPQPWTVYLQTSVQIMGRYYVASHVIERGSVIGPADLDAREGDLLRLRRVISDPGRIVGWIANRRLRAGGAVEASALRDPNAIERGQQVRTVARGIGFEASGEGQALESGGPGARIQVRTPNGQIITGTVIDAHTVQVMM